ncbi:saccharopine dehydrogenase family protein [Dyella sp.]|uniref:saccharopine dehydrogenase family protein n=1 Tax=Dyella sp. TaxID=1869338 RepID=UPI002D788089|nr:saccharopine dehydrogenase NADP-binding domain-containing protein [Dyella sp.]HET6431998.1 saccharopine dehydrogenase NADP-binding domain-containing protein [Dyella sp.]
MGLRVLLIGATGVFGSRIARRLAGDATVALTLAGRHGESLARLGDVLGDRTVATAVLDVQAPDLVAALGAHRPQLVIHAAGPFQQQDYRVAEACIALGSDYVDLADGRAFVCGISTLDARARAAGCVVLSGASSVPALSGAVVDALAPRFAQLHAIRSAISPGNRSPRGDATVAAILGYCGRPVPVWRDGRWQTGYGWSDHRRQRFATLRRPVALCDVPDLALFPARYHGVRTVEFRAGLELGLLHWGTWGAALLVRLGWVRDLPRHARALRRLSERFVRFGSDVGGMAVELEGVAVDGSPLALRWWLEAGAGDGPEIPAMPAVVLARQLAAGRRPRAGARACLGELTLEALLNALAALDVRSGVASTARADQSRKR